MNRDELANIQNEIINAQENVIRTGEDLIKAYEELTALLQVKEGMCQCFCICGTVQP